MCFSVRGNGHVKEKKKTKVIKIHGRSFENVNRRLEAVESKRSIAEDFAVPQSIPRKRLKTETVPTSLGHLKVTFSSKKEK